jgi:hypothetical protein
MQQFLLARGLQTIPLEDITLNLQPLDLVVMKAPFKKKTILQDYCFLNHPITTMFNGLIIVHVLTNKEKTQQTLLLVSNEPHFVLSKPDLMQVMLKATSIARTIAVVCGLSTQAASLRSFFLKTAHIGEILAMDEVLINKPIFGDVPRFRILTSEEQVLLLKERCSTKQKLPEMSYLEDGTGRWLGFLPGMIVYNVDKNLYRYVVE